MTNLLSLLLLTCLSNIVYAQGSYLKLPQKEQEEIMSYIANFNTIPRAEAYTAITTDGSVRDKRTYQQAEPLNPLARESYLEKSKTQKTVAWVLMGIGAGILGYTAIDASVNKAADRVGGFIGGLQTGRIMEPEKRSYGVPIAIGLASIVGSIVLFSAAAKNRKYAADASVYLKMERTPALQSPAIPNPSHPAILVKISLQ